MFNLVSLQHCFTLLSIFQKPIEIEIRLMRINHFCILNQNSRVCNICFGIILSFITLICVKMNRWRIGLGLEAAIVHVV